MSRNTSIYWLLILLPLLLGGIAIYADQIVQLNYTVTATTLAKPGIYNSTQQLTTVDPDGSSTYYVRFTVSSPTYPLDALDYVYVYLYESSHTTDYLTYTADGVTQVKLTWDENTDQWSLAKGTTTEWTLGTPTDPGTGSQANSFNFEIPINISHVATAGTWYITVKTVYWVGASDTQTSDPFQMTTYQSLALDKSTITLGNITQGNPSTVVNVTATIKTNARWTLQVKGTDITGAQTIDLDTTNALFCDETPSLSSGNGFYVRNTYHALNSYTNQTAITSEAGITVTLYFQITTQITTPTGTYTVEISVGLVAV